MWSLLAVALADVPNTQAQTHVLPNGLTVILEEDHRADEVALFLSYGVGSRDERPGEYGCAHLFEHLMFEGSAHVGTNLFDEWLTAAGGSNNAYTSNDETAYHMVFPSGALDLALFLESDRMGFLDAGLVPANLANQSEVVLQERYQGYAEPHGRDYDALGATLFPAGHPYHVPVIGTVDDVKGFQLDAVVDFWRRHYRPRNAVLTLVGHFDADEALARVQHWFSDVPDTGAPEPRATPAQALAAGHEARAAALADAVEDTTVYAVWRVPDQNHADAKAYEVLSWLLDDGAGTRVPEALYLSKRLATSAAAWSSVGEVDGMFVIEATAPKTPVSRLLKAIDAVLAELQRSPPTEAELQRAKAAVTSGLRDNLKSAESRAWLLTTCFKQRGSPNCLADELAAAEAVTAADVQRVAAALRPDARSTLVVHPQAAAAPAGATPVELP